MANKNQGPLSPAPMALPGRIRDYLQEVMGLSPAQVRGVGLGLQASLSSTTPVADTYKVPGDQELVIFSIQGYLRFTALNTEPAVLMGNLNPDYTERYAIKSMNCLLNLMNIDRSLNIFDVRDIPMSAITPPTGAPLYFPAEAPLLVPSGHNLRATFTLQDSTAAIVGNATVYGILLGGALIPKRE